MSVRILHDTTANQAALYCSTSGWTLGPVFYDECDGLNAGERAHAFLDWYQDSYGDPRSAPQMTLKYRHSTWTRQQELRKEILEAEL